MARALPFPARAAAAAVLVLSLACAWCPRAFAQMEVHDHAGFLQSLKNNADAAESHLESILTAEEQLRTAIGSSSLLQSAYAVNSLLGSSPKLTELLDLIEDYRSLYDEVLSDVRSYESRGLVSSSQLYYSTQLLNMGLDDITDGVDYVLGGVLKSKGMTTGERLNHIDELKKKISDRIDQLLTFKKRKLDNPVRDSVLVQTSFVINTMLSPVPLLGPVGPRRGSANDAVISDPVITDLLEDASMYDTGATLDDVESGGRSLYQTALDITTYVVAALAALFFAINYGRSRKGERQASDALFKVFYGLLFALTAMQIVSKVFME